MEWFFVRFVFGLVLGSFINVIALRYEGDAFLLARPVVGGRSRCPYCRTTLRWFELIPLVSFVFQRGKCRSCGVRLSWQYPLVELASSFILVFVPSKLHALVVSYQLPVTSYQLLSVLWSAAFLSLLLMALIDFRLKIIPNELNVFLVMLGVGAAFASMQGFGLIQGGFVGHYVLLAGFRDSIFINRFAGGVAGFSFLGLLALVTRGRGMGMGDVKLMGALGILFGWPEVLLVILLGFIVGSLAGIVALMRKTHGMKSILPFGPFLALGSLLVFFWGFEIVRGYFSLFNLNM